MSATESTGLPVYDFKSRAIERRSELSPAGRAVIDLLLGNPESIVFTSASALGEAAGTSDATVVRTVKALGYSGLDELRQEIRTAIDSRLSPIRRVQQSLDWAGTSPEDVLDHTLALHATMIADARETLSPTAFAAAVDEVTTASRVLAYGVGALGSIADYLRLRLSRIGIPASSSSQTGFELADFIMTIRPGHALVVFAYDSVPREIEVLIDEAGTRGARLVLVTDNLDRLLGGRVHHVLSAPVFKTEHIASFSTPLIVADALALAAASARRETIEAAMTDLQRVRGLLGRVDRI